MVWEHWGWVPDMYSDSLYNSSCEHPGAVMNIIYVSLQRYSVKNNLIFTPFTLIEVVQLMKRIQKQNLYSLAILSSMNRHCSASYSVPNWIMTNRWMLLKLDRIVKGKNFFPPSLKEHPSDYLVVTTVAPCWACRRQCHTMWRK